MNLAALESLRQMFVMAVGIKVTIDLIQEIGTGAQNTKEQLDTLNVTER